MNDTLLKVLSWVDTPTVCSAIELVLGKNGYRQFTRGEFICSNCDALPLVGYARTAKIAAAMPPNEPTEVTERRQLDYFRYISESSDPSISVVEDTDYPNSAGAMWSEVNAQIHKAFGIRGALSNGMMHGLPDLPEDFPILAGCLGPGRGHLHMKEFDTPVNIYGLEIRPGDLVHGDRHGAVVVPKIVLPNLQDGIGKVLEAEKLILGPANSPDFDFQKLADAWKQFMVARSY